MECGHEMCMIRGIEGGIWRYLGRGCVTMGLGLERVWGGVGSWQGRPRDGRVFFSEFDDFLEMIHSSQMK